MKLTPENKLGELVKKHPFLIEFLPTLSPEYERLKNPVLRRTLLGRATLEVVAKKGGFEVEILIAEIESEIVKRESDSMDDRKAVLKGIIRDLHAGVDMEILRKRFADLVKDVTPSEIAEVEQSLIDEGLPESEVKRLCDVHVEVFKHSLDEQEVPRPPAGHPIHTLMVENRASENIMVEIGSILKKIGHPPDAVRFKNLEEELGRLVEKLSEIEKHYLRKENQLFPRLEERGMSGPSQVMWAIHDDVRSALKKAKNQLSVGDGGVVSTLEGLIQIIKDMIYKEENILYPMSLEALTMEDWLKVKEDEAEIGYAWIEPLTDWTPDIDETFKTNDSLVDSMKLELDTGSLTPEQVNLLLTHLPVDITYVDENDRVSYFSKGKERIFPRSKGIIGRAVQKCHPPNSVHIVEKIVEAFKEGSKDSAEFWINLSGRFIYIRYFAVRDTEGTYKGTLEVSQDVTEIKALEGEQRLLDWKK